MCIFRAAKEKAKAKDAAKKAQKVLSNSQSVSCSGDITIITASSKKFLDMFKLQFLTQRTVYFGFFYIQTRNLWQSPM